MDRLNKLILILSAFILMIGLSACSPGGDGDVVEPGSVDECDWSAKRLTK